MNTYKIKSYEEYMSYLEADRISLKRNKWTFRKFFTDDVWAFQRLLRKLEYLTNCNKNYFSKKLCRFLFLRQSRKLGFSIPINTFGPGLAIAHYGTIVVNHGARIGANCRLHVCVNIGTTAGKDSDAPKLGDNCYIGPGAKLFGLIQIGANTAIGANSVVNKSFPEGNCVLAGVPAKVVSNKSTEGMLVQGWKL